jgi:DNA-binding MarR family transcriptional regulator
MSPKDKEWKRSREVYYTVSSQLRMPWATYSKLTKFLSERGFIEFNKAIYKNRKTHFVRLTSLGRGLVAMYVGLGGKTLKDLEPEEQIPPLTA